MTDKLTTNISALEQWLAEKGWRIVEQHAIDYGRQVAVSDGINKVQVNFYQTGKIVAQGKAGDLKTAVAEWANLMQAGLQAQPVTPTARPQNRIARYFVIPDRIADIESVVRSIPGEVNLKAGSGPAENYRAEIKQDNQRVTVTQYGSGTLLVQGLSSAEFDLVCEILDRHLSQSFAERAARYIPAPAEQVAATSYLANPESENEATAWLLAQIDRQVFDFLYANDQRTLVAAAGVRNALSKSEQSLPDYSVVVMPFAKPYEGFLIRLAVHLHLVQEETLTERANAIEIGSWLENIRARLPDVKRFAETSDALMSAWGCRNKAVHSDFAHPLSVLASLAEAELEIAVILRAMARAYRVFVQERVELKAEPDTKQKVAAPSDKPHKFEKVDREILQQRLIADGVKVEPQAANAKNLWVVNDKPNLTVVAPRGPEGVIVVRGNLSDQFVQQYQSLLQSASQPAAQTALRIGVDESGKGDLFGPLVVAGVAVTSETEALLARRGVRDSKTISDSQITELAKLIRENCQTETIVLLPPEYNAAYEQYGRNLNRLLAWGHANVIARLSKRTGAQKAISDQFGDEQLILEALKQEQCSIALEQRPHAESDMAVAAASIIARAEFIAAIQDYTRKARVEIPLGASATQVKEIGKLIYRRWGKRGLERIAKMHFKTVREIMNEVNG